MASPTRDAFTPGKQARVSLSFSESIAQRVNHRCRELGCDPKDYVRYCVMRELDSPGHQQWWTKRDDAGRLLIMDDEGHVAIEEEAAHFRPTSSKYSPKGY